MATRIFNLNDPNWGKKPQDDDRKINEQRPPQGNDGPPDLDQVWSDVEQKFKSLFGGGRNNRGGGPRQPRPPHSGGSGSSGQLSPKFIRHGIIFGLIVVVLLWLASGFFIVREGQVGVITQFGKYHRTVMPGFQWHIPTPIQRVEKVNVAAVRAFSIGYRENSRNKVLAEALMLTEDENIVDMQFDVQYRIKAMTATEEGIEQGLFSPAASYLYATADPDESVRQAAETAMREVVGKESMNKILYESRTQAAQDVKTLMQHILDRYNTGIEVITVAIQNVQPPEQVQAAFEDAIKAGQDNERQKNEGQAYASRVIPEAHGRAARLIQDAEGYRARVVGEATGQAERFKQIAEEYAQAPEITRERMYITAMQDIFSQSSKIMLDTSEQSNPLMLMPLDSILGRDGSAGQGSSSGAATSLLDDWSGSRGTTAGANGLAPTNGEGPGYTDGSDTGRPATQSNTTTEGRGNLSRDRDASMRNR